MNSTSRKKNFHMVKLKLIKSIKLQVENMELKEKVRQFITVLEITILYHKIFAYFCS
jgi:hypothetical protein